MAMHLRDLWDWRGNLSRGAYARWGFLLLAIKYNLDRIIATTVFNASWYPWTYFSIFDQGVPPSAPASMNFLFCMLATSLPFIFWGVILTQRRLRDAGWAPTFVVLFFVPVINLLFFSLLCLQPTHESPSIDFKLPGWWRKLLTNDSRMVSAGLGIAASVLLGVGLTVIGTMFFNNYGVGLFVGTPFMMGFFGALFHGVARPRSWKECAAVAISSVVLTSVILLLAAVEGVICILMAAPIGLVLALLGGTVGWTVQRECWSTRLGQTRLYAAAWVLAPVLLALEANRPTLPPLVAATTVCEIAAPPATVWRHVVAFGELAPPTERIFLAGIAYPLRARLEGRGVGAVRYCEFSTGPFVEPITAWEEAQRLAFDVSSQPHPMREWSPYAGLNPAHLEGFFRSRRGEFRLTALPGGRTRLEGTTWYEQDIWPQAYWQQWSDYLIHSIHRRVLNHIKAEAEADRAP